MSSSPSFVSLPFSEPHEEIPVAPPTTAASSVEEPEGERINPLSFVLVTVRTWGGGQEAKTLL